MRREHCQGRVDRAVGDQIGHAAACLEGSIVRIVDEHGVDVGYGSDGLKPVAQTHCARGRRTCGEVLANSQRHCGGRGQRAHFAAARAQWLQATLRMYNLQGGGICSWHGHGSGLLEERRCWMLEVMVTSKQAAAQGSTEGAATHTQTSDVSLPLFV